MAALRATVHFVIQATAVQLTEFVM